MNPFISILRILSVLLVFMGHTATTFNVHYGLEFDHLWQIPLRIPPHIGVWILYVVSGFFAARSFLSNKYTLDRKGILSYYKNRVVKIWLPTLLFVVLGIILWDSSVLQHPIRLWTILTCTYYGGFEHVKYTGIVWYVCVLMWLYVLTPFLIMAYRYVVKRCRITDIGLFICSVVLIASVVILSFRMTTCFLGLWWIKWSYGNVVGNIDLFIAGMGAAKIAQLAKGKIDAKRQTTLMCLLSFALLTLIALHTCLYFYRYLFLCYYVVPTFYLFIVAASLVVADNTQWGKSRWITWVNLISIYTFEFFMWHLVAVNSAIKFIDIPDVQLRHLLSLALGLLITAIVAIPMKMVNDRLFISRKAF